jgi:hypothetical protein
MLSSPVIEQIQIIQDSSLPLENKDNLIKTVHTALDWTPEQRAMYNSAVKDWDRNQPRVQKTLPNGRKIWVDQNLKD